MARGDETRQKFECLVSVLQDRRFMLIVLQDFPDPDAIAAAAALKDLANAVVDVPSSVVCGGMVGRAENRALVRYLGLNLQAFDKVDISQFDVIAMVDTQPGTGNNSLGKGFLPQIVIDHHPIRNATRKAGFHDIRSRYGATSTILYEYLMQAGIVPSVPLATALVHGIRSDTDDLGREFTQADIEAFLALYPTANKRMLGRIEMEREPKEYFQMLAVGLRNAKTYGNCVVTSLGAIENPDIVGEVADLLLRNEETLWALSYGLCGDRMLLSLRTTDFEANAGKIMNRIVGRLGTGGGHNSIAGGQISMGDESPGHLKRLEKTILQRYLRAVGATEEKGQPLVSL